MRKTLTFRTSDMKFWYDKIFNHADNVKSHLIHFCADKINKIKSLNPKFEFSFLFKIRNHIVVNPIVYQLLLRFLQEVLV